MPNNVAEFAKQLTGKFSSEKDTEFWEASSIAEFEKYAAEGKFEIVPTVDMKTERAYLVGFEVEEGNITSLSGDIYIQLKMYFVEVSKGEFDAWWKKIQEHRKAQEMEMGERWDQAKRKQKKVTGIITERTKEDD